MPVIINGTTGVTFPNGVTMSDGTSAPVTVAQGGTGANTAANARTSLGLAIGTDVLAPNGSGANLTSLNASAISAGTLAVAQGGTGANTATAAFNALNPMTTTGDIIYEASPTTAARLGIGSTGQVLTVAGGIPSWASLPAGGVTSLNGQTGAITNTDLYAIGSYVTGRPANGNNITPNTTIAGSSLLNMPGGTNWQGGTGFIFYDANFQQNFGSTTSTVNTGTWRCTSLAAGNGSLNISGLWVRIS